jgi:hypothetical protein
MPNNTKRELDRNSSTEDLLAFAKKWGYGDSEGCDASPSWMSQELQERGYKEHNLMPPNKTENTSLLEESICNRMAKAQAEKTTNPILPNGIYPIKEWEEKLAILLQTITAQHDKWQYAMHLYSPIKDFIRQVEQAAVEKARKEENNQWRSGNRCNYCGKEKEVGLSIICGKCFENN